MSEQLYTVEQAAGRLKLHAKTVLRFIREGRLRATRVGKSYRIQGADLDALAGVRPSAARAQARATCIVDLPDVSREEAQRWMTRLQGPLRGPEARAEPLRLETTYDEGRRELKVVIIGSPGDASALLQMIEFLRDA